MLQYANLLRSLKTRNRNFLGCSLRCTRLREDIPDAQPPSLLVSLNFRSLYADFWCQGANDIHRQAGIVDLLRWRASVHQAAGVANASFRVVPVSAETRRRLCIDCGR